MANPFIRQAERLLVQGHAADALRVARMGSTLHPDSPALWQLGAGCASQLGDDEHAMSCWLRFIELRPAAAHAYNDLAIVVERLGRPAADAEVLYRTAIRIDPGYARAHANLGVLLCETGREAEAEASFRTALAIRPDFRQTRLNLAQLLLRQGRFAEGWPLHEGRLTVDARRPPRPGYECACRQWQGEALAGKSILVIPEQGLGDEIQFCRYVPWLKAQGPEQLTLACWPSQTPLLKTLAGADTVIPLTAVQPHLTQHDYWTFLLSLPRLAGTELSSVPAAVPYLFADQTRLRSHPPLPAGKARRVGIVWRGNPRHSNDADRSLPSLDLLAPLWSVAGARYFSLQKSKAPLPAATRPLPLIDLAPRIDDWADTAALLSQLDLLVSVDSSVAHLAGAMGLPCWILLPHFKTDWRWLAGRDDSPWYPATRLFRQPTRGDWQTPVAELTRALRRFVEESVRADAPSSGVAMPLSPACV